MSVQTPAWAQDETDRPESSPAEQDEQARAREALQLGRLHFERGEFDRAIEAFGSILGTPVKLRTRRDLHQGFLYFAFTLVLQGEQEEGREKLRLALRLDPEFTPSPVTTRPDLLAFYSAEQEAFLAENGSTAAPPETIFPELQVEPGQSTVIRYRRFVPLFGIGIRQMGHPRLGNGLLATEIGAAGTNVASLILRAAYISDRTPNGMTATYVSRAMTYVSFGVFWGAFLADFIVSMALRRYYTLHPEKRREGPPTPRRRARRARPELVVGPSALTLRFW